MGELKDILDLYITNPNIFAGGEKAVKTNFPSQPELIKAIRKFSLK